ncbi:MBL fold metallo-hydrolase [Actinomadura algeriensis]|uniref:Glyoxylase-like metal-dependent hydrolase (Beta-lactamase superfamily II) n=1 Tax=Actinomadura algeriensis TaxID=1679523 RepID=A0ABR9JPZ6_9ACTN|nr:MBL fold metallo-hydrolase [Actinomadura algeriensis]MBE1532473.1 glyoxylase-like metal-dependent hydrolase (beta-lactamase superfamily II) [Actinomadura algeriensis]
MNSWNTEAGIRSVDVGELRVSYVPDGVGRLRSRGWFPDVTDDDWARHPDVLDESAALVASMGGLLVEHGDRALLIDAGFGPEPQADDPANVHVGAITTGAFLDNLAELGRGPDRVEAVAYTHLHPDHVGWSDRFARHLVAAPEWDHRDGELDAIADRVETIGDGDEIFPGVRVLATPGHTPGHTAYVLESGGERLVALGDAFHSPVQIEHPEWRVALDGDQERAIGLRRRLVDELDDGRTRAFGIHFADVQFGRVRDGAWHPEH